MRKIHLSLFVCTLLLTSPAFAQEASGWDKRVFGFAGGGTEIGYKNFFHIGAGVEAISSVGVGFVIDVGCLRHTPSTYAYGTVTTGAVYEFPLEGKLRPYARGGIGLIADSEGGAFLWNIGGGINYWFHEHGGLKVELRDSWGRSYFRDGLVEVTVGVMYRF